MKTNELFPQLTTSTRPLFSALCSKIEYWIYLANCGIGFRQGDGSCKQTEQQTTQQEKPLQVSACRNTHNCGSDFVVSYCQIMPSLPPAVVSGCHRVMAPSWILILFLRNLPLSLPQSHTFTSRFSNTFFSSPYPFTHTYHPQDGP